MSDQPMTVTDEDRALIKTLLDANDELCRAIDNGLVFTGECELAAAHRIAAAQAERDAVVKWLMREEEGYPSSEYSGFAAMICEEIEAGEHLK